MSLNIYIYIYVYMAYIYIHTIKAKENYLCGKQNKLIGRTNKLIHIGSIWTKNKNELYKNVLVKSIILHVNGKHWLEKYFPFSVNRALRISTGIFLANLYITCGSAPYKYRIFTFIHTEYLSKYLHMSSFWQACRVLMEWIPFALFKFIPRNLIFNWYHKWVYFLNFIIRLFSSGI